MCRSEDDKRWFSGELSRLMTGTVSDLPKVQHNKTGREHVDTGLGGVLASLDRLETSLVAEFRNWGSKMEALQRSDAARIRAIQIKMESLSDRVKKLEDGSNGRSHPEQPS